MKALGQYNPSEFTCVMRFNFKNFVVSLRTNIGALKEEGTRAGRRGGGGGSAGAQPGFIGWGYIEIIAKYIDDHVDTNEIIVHCHD